MIEIQPGSDVDIDEYHAMRCAVYAVDYPELPTPTRQATAAVLAVPPVHLGERLMWQAHLDGRLVAAATSYLPVDGNEHLAIAQLFVHPEFRRQGIATELLRAITPVLRERGRTSIEGRHVTEGGAGDHWTKALGFRAVHTTLTQILNFGEVDRGRWEVAVPEGYRLVRWIGAAPDDVVESYASARNAIADAPAGLVTPKWSVDRVRRVEAGLAKHGVECRTVVAVDPDGEVVGLTELEYRPLNPMRLMQGDTAVLAAHRGHGLGLAMKAAMLRWFTADRDGLREIWTNTGADNTHMVEVNLRLGFETARRSNVVSLRL
ncbi:GNAT family N-acetyltransferase [Kutzneria sp. CA-103260]|uniref:GNAT family N-acetyltransferase n=1 Tax=Kutzneria sp. CA-103260 TaxID=2802641 RepID=UPI001BA8A678|nr:GNAT family N-acetyltransferase [Kutzneria sp. CA-103260]QUQ67588.1 GNAT family N-acetyltransferase [Kutzneria sp. CA-103260]